MNARHQGWTKTKLVFLLAGLVGMLTASSPALAHHGYAAYQMDKTVTLKGTITSFDMVNPHSRFAFDVKTDKGEIQHWMVETGATVRGMKAGGFTRDTLKPGDAITITFNPSVNGTRIGVLKSIALPDGRVLPLRNQDQGGAGTTAP